MRSIAELKKSIEEKASAVKSADDGAADLKRRVEDLSKSLEESEKDYQVKSPLAVGLNSIDIVVVCVHTLIESHPSTFVERVSLLVRAAEMRISVLKIN